MSRAEMLQHGQNIANRWYKRNESTIKAQQWIDIQKKKRGIV